MRSGCAATFTRRDFGISAASAAALLALGAAPAAAAGPATGSPAIGRPDVGTPAASGPRPAGAPARPAARPTLGSGDHGAAVTTLQKRLAALHYDTGTADGAFGASTLHGVYAFQKVQGLHVDGVVGPATWAALAAPRRPAVRHVRSAAAVEIDLGLRVLYLTRAGQVTRIVDASPGKPSTPTPPGAYAVTRRIDGWRHSPLGLLWRPNYFHAGYAVHGAPSVPTYAASHGCVRVTLPAMNRLWPVLRIAEKVWVYR